MEITSKEIEGMEAMEAHKEFKLKYSIPFRFFNQSNSNATLKNYIYYVLTEANKAYGFNIFMFKFNLNRCIKQAFILLNWALDKNKIPIELIYSSKTDNFVFRLKCKINKEYYFEQLGNFLKPHTLIPEYMINIQELLIEIIKSFILYKYSQMNTNN
jgi:hypothetical protein